MEQSFRTDEKVKTSTKWFFALGEIFQGGFFNIVNFFYGIFLTDVMGISPIWAANVFLFGRIWDAVTDPVMGFITDNTRTRLGRRRPYFIIGAPIVLISFIMMWYPLSSGSETSRILYFMFVYMLINTTSDILTVPYLAMTSELSTDYSERTSITNARMIVNVASTIICAVVPMLIVGLYQDIRTGYIVMSVVFGLFFTIPMVIVYMKVPEHKQFSEGRKTTWHEMFSVLRLRVFRRFMIMYLGIVTAIDITSMIFAYYMTYALHRASELSFVLGALLISQVAFIPVASRFVSKTSKNKSIIFGNIGWTIVAASTFLVMPDSPGFTAYVLAVLLGGFISFSIVGYTAIFGDITEVGEYHFGYRSEGSFSGIQQFIRKCASALANWIALTLLGLSGFVNPREVVENGVTTIITQSQADIVIITIRCIIGLSSGLLLIPSTIIAVRWLLSKAKHAKLIGYLDRKRAGLEIDPETEREIAEICKPLV